MKGGTVWLTFGLVGFDITLARVFELRLGVIAFGLCWGSITDKLRDGLRAALRALGRKE